VYLVIIQKPLETMRAQERSTLKWWLAALGLASSDGMWKLSCRSISIARTQIC
jgi:hypothetical protein